PARCGLSGCPLPHGNYPTWQPCTAGRNGPLDTGGDIPLRWRSMTVQAELLIEIEAFLAKRGDMAETTFGRLAVNDGKFVRRLRDGCNMTLAPIGRTREFMKAAARKPAPAPKAIRNPRAPKRKRPASSPRSTAPKAP